MGAWNYQTKMSHTRWNKKASAVGHWAFSLNTVDQEVIYQWSNRLPSQLTFIPRWVYKICLSLHYTHQPVTQAVIIACKKSPQLITYDTHMFIRSPEGASQLADSDTVLTVLNGSTHAPFICSHCDKIFSRAYSLRRHQDTCKARNGPFKCPKCDLVFTNYMDVSPHTLDLNTSVGMGDMSDQDIPNRSWQESRPDLP